MLYIFGLAIAAAFGVALAAFGCGLAQGRAVASALEAVARQPEATGRIQTLLIIGLAFIESLTIYALVIALIYLGKLPSLEQAMQLIGR